MTDYYYLCKNQTRNCGPSHFLCAIIDTQMNNPHCWAKANKDQIWERERKRERKEARQGGRERERNKGWNRDDGREWDPGFSKHDTNTKDPVPDSVSKMEPRIPVGTFVHAQFGTTEACMAQTCFYFTDSAACIIHPSPLFSPGSLHHGSPPPTHKRMRSCYMRPITPTGRREGEGSSRHPGSLQEGRNEPEKETTCFLAPAPLSSDTWGQSLRNLRNSNLFLPLLLSGEGEPGYKPASQPPPCLAALLTGSSPTQVILTHGPLDDTQGPKRKYQQKSGNE